MSVNVGQIFVRARDPQKLVQSVEAHLAAPAAGNPDLLDEEGRRSVLVLPPVRGWTTILESRQHETDPTLAAVLARDLRERTVRLVVRGGCFDYFWERYEDGASTESAQLLTTAQATAGELPEFSDAEVIAWSHALRAGIPTETLFLRMSDVLESGTPATDAPMAVRFDAGVEQDRWRLRRAKVAVRLGAAVREPRVHLDAAELDRGGRVALAVERRRLWGEPTPAAAGKLAALLMRVRERYAFAFQVAPLCIRFCVWAGAAGKEWVPLPADLAGPREE